MKKYIKNIDFFRLACYNTHRKSSSEDFGGLGSPGAALCRACSLKHGVKMPVQARIFTCGLIMRHKIYLTNKTDLPHLRICRLRRQIHKGLLKFVVSYAQKIPI